MNKRYKNLKNRGVYIIKKRRIKIRIKSSKKRILKNRNNPRTEIRNKS